MGFAIGDKVVHPGIGAGRIVATKAQELVEGFQNYYVIEISGRESTIYIPQRKMDDVGVRLAMSPTEVDHVFEVLSGEPHQLPKDYKVRQEQVEEKIKSGSPVQVAEVVRDLLWHERVAHLTRKDGDLLARARRLLRGELALVTGVTPEDVAEAIDEAVKAAVMEESGQEEGEAEADTPVQLAGVSPKRRSLLEALGPQIAKALGLRTR